MRGFLAAGTVTNSRPVGFAYISSGEGHFEILLNGAKPAVVLLAQNSPALISAVGFVAVLMGGAQDAHCVTKGERLRSKLQCGMSVRDVDRVAKAVGLPAARRSERPGEWFIRRGSEIVILNFEADRLFEVQERHAFGVTGLKLLPKENVCTHGRTGFSTLTIRAPSALSGAEVWLDGERQLRLSAGDPTGGEVRRSIGSVPSGSHVLRIEREGFRPIERSFATSVEQEVAEIVIEPGEVLSLR